jgi:hypothetical protein
MFKALTASTRLTALRMAAAGKPTFRRFQIEPLALPQAACQHMLPSGKIMPLLRVLQLAGSVCQASPRIYFGPGPPVDDSLWLMAASARIDAAIIGRIAGSCPALQVCPGERLGPGAIVLALEHACDERSSKSVKPM